MKTILQIVLGIAAIAVFVLILSTGLDKQEVVDCNNLVSQSEEFANAGFYITSWEKEMCDAHGITINAPVR